MPRRLIRIIDWSNRQPAVWSLLGPLVLVAASLTLRQLMGEGAEQPLFIVFFPAILLSGLLFRRGAAYLMVLLSTIAAIWWHISPLDIDRYQEHRYLLVVFLGCAVASAFLVEALRDGLCVVHDMLFEREQTNERLAAGERQKVLLLREASHRYRNDLQRLAAMIGHHAQVSPNAEVRNALRATEDRIVATAAVSARLDRILTLDGEDRVNSAEFLSGLIADMRITLPGRLPIQVHLDVEAHDLSIQRAGTLGLAINEMWVNAIKYAFPGGRDGNIGVGFRRDGNMFTLTFSDDGVGFDPASAPQGSGIGQRLLRSLTAQLDGDLQVTARRGQGSRATLAFPV